VAARVLGGEPDLSRGAVGARSDGGAGVITVDGRRVVAL
jgi:exopolysaccharide biosynthesis protein